MFPSHDRWGGEVVLQRLKKHDIHNNRQLFDEIEDRIHKVKESKDRDMKNKTEAWLADNHSKFKKSWSDVRVANMDMTERRRRRYESRIKN